MCTIFDMNGFDLEPGDITAPAVAQEGAAADTRAVEDSPHRAAVQKLQVAKTRERRARPLHAPGRPADGPALPASARFLVPDCGHYKSAEPPQAPPASSDDRYYY